MVAVRTIPVLRISWPLRISLHLTLECHTMSWFRPSALMINDHRPPKLTVIDGIGVVILVVPAES